MNKRELAHKIYNEEIVVPFFDKEKMIVFFKVPKPQAIKYIERLLNYRNHKRELIWFVCIDKRWVSFQKVFDFLLINKGLFKDFSKVKMERFANVIEGHGLRMQDFFSIYQPVIKNIDFWYPHVKKNKQLIGLLELLPLDKLYKVHMDKFIEQYNRLVMNFEIEGLRDLRTLQKGDKELTSIRDMQRESVVMQNCIGGYSFALRELYMRFFHLEFAEEKAVMSIRKINDKIHLMEIKGIRNTEVSMSILRKAKLLVDEINRKYPDCVKENFFMNTAQYSPEDREFIDILNLARIRDATAHTRPMLNLDQRLDLSEIFK